MSETYEPLNVIYILTIRDKNHASSYYSIPYVIKSDAQDYAKKLVEFNSNITYSVTTENIRGDIDVFVRRDA